MENLYRFKEKKAIVTGSGSGIGRGIALRLAKEGAYVAVHDRNLDGAKETVKQIKEAGGKAAAYQVDVSDAKNVREIVDKTVENLGKIDFLVCNAGVNRYKEFFDFTDDDWDFVIRVNLTGVWNYCRYVSEIMAKTGGGAIVNTSSMGSFSSSYMRVPYMSSKGGVKMMTQALAQDLAEYHIRVNAVAPGSIETEMTKPDIERPGVNSRAMVAAMAPLRRYGKPEDIAAAAAFLLSTDAEYITGETLVVDGGISAGNMVGLPILPVPKPGYEVPWLDDFDYVKEYKEFLEWKNNK